LTNRAGWPAAIIFLSLAACGRAPDETGPPPLIVDRFEVGNGTYVRSLAIDEATRSLWVGSSVGVMEIDLATHQLRNTFTRSDGLANEYVFAIGVDSLGYKWFGTNAGGMSRYRDGEWQVYFPMHGLADYWIYAFAEQAERQYWVGSWAGANKVDLETMEFSLYKEELVNEWVYGIAVDSDDRVWFGTEGGVSMLDGETWTHWTHEQGLGAGNEAQLPISRNTGLGTRQRHDLSVLVGGRQSYNPDYVFSILADDDDVVWAGTWGAGVGRFEDGAWTNYTSADGLAGNIVYAIAQGPDGVYWFGTNNGMSRFDGKSWKNYGTVDGLFGNDVYAIAVTGDNQIWAGTRNGVVRLAHSPHGA
jgi:ligand-binding sensor domain-containing protein